MKFLTLNTHSWMEEDAEGKFQTLKETDPKGSV